MWLRKTPRGYATHKTHRNRIELTGKASSRLGALRTSATMGRREQTAVSAAVCRRVELILDRKTVHYSRSRGMYNETEFPDVRALAAEIPVRTMSRARLLFVKELRSGLSLFVGQKCDLSPRSRSSCLRRSRIRR